MKKKKKLRSVDTGAAEINVMPFIDIFSLLCTFLLFSSVFITIGIQTVQIPFFTDAKDDKQEKKPPRELVLLLEVGKKNLTLTSQWSREPLQKRKQNFKNTEEGRENLHDALVKLKVLDTSSEKIKLFVDNSVTYDSMSDVLDAVIELESEDKQELKLARIEKLFPRVVLGNVIF